MNILIESTKAFENDLDGLSREVKAVLIETVNATVDRFKQQQIDIEAELSPPWAATIGEYEASLYVIQVPHQLQVILAIDEDPIFDQTLFTLFRAVSSKDLAKAYQDVVKKLSQEFTKPSRQVAEIL